MQIEEDEANIPCHNVDTPKMVHQAEKGEARTLFQESTHLRVVVLDAP